MITWSGYNWLTKERWGEIHPDKSYCWYDESAINILDNNSIELKTQYNPKYFEELKKTSNIGVGLISCTEKFKHGTFEIEAKLPFDDNLWPAFWMWSWDSWPPEIDILEGYSDNCPNFFKFRITNPFGFWNIQTNVHYIENEQNKSVKGKTHWFGFKNPTKNFIKYKVEWFPNIINFYYDNKKVRSITDRKILDEFNKTTMNVIINNHVTKRVNTKNPPVSSFIIKYFKYVPY